MKIVFAESEDALTESCKKEFADAVYNSEKVTPQTIDSILEFKDVEILSTFIYSELTAEALSKLANLKMIATRGTGFNHIDIDYCKSHNIIVSNVPTYGVRTVAEHTFGLLLTLTRKLYDSIDRTKHGSFANTDLCGLDLYGKTIGLIGLGNIGTEVLKIAHGFGMEILVHTRTQNTELQKEIPHEYVDLPTLLAQSDVITLHVPYTKETHHIINLENISQFKKGAYLINTARGGLIDPDALLNALNQDIFSGVGLDVLEEEEHLKEEIELLSKEFMKKVDYKTLVYDHMIVSHPKVVVTPHNAFNSQEAQEKITCTTIENIQNFLKGTPQNTVT